MAPNFFVIGAARAGTTSVYRYLAEHPQVYMSPIKEPSYFAPDIIAAELPRLRRHGTQRGLDAYLNGPMRDRRGGVVVDWNQYLKLFRNATREAAIGEASTAYLISSRAPELIRESVPGARIVIMLRSPIERAFSTYLMFRRNGRLRADFSEVIRSEDSTEMVEWRRRILETRKIAEGVKRFLASFPEDQIRWYFHEEFSTGPLAIMRRMYAFLRVDPAYQPNLARRYNEDVLPRFPLLHQALDATGIWALAKRIAPKDVRPPVRRLLFHTRSRPCLTVADRAYLVDYFAADVIKLGRLVRRDLSHWLRQAE